MQKLLFVFLISLTFFGCKSSNLRKESDISSQNDSINIYAFIGEKISVTEFDPNKNNTKKEFDSITGDTVIRVRRVMDYAFNAKYKVLKKVFNNLKTDTISFVVYDHYGRPNFERYENVLLYLSLSKDKEYYYHQKYLYDPLKKSKSGKWLGLKGEAVQKLFAEKKNGVLKSRGLFDK